MIKYKHGDNEYITLSMLRQAFPGASFPKTPNKAQLAMLGIEVIEVVPPEPTLDELKRQKKSEIANTRWQAQTANIIYDGNVYHAGEQATASIHAAVTAALSGNREWKTADGTSVKLNANKLQKLFVAIEERKEAGFIKEAALSSAIDACETAEALSEIEW